MEYLIIGFLMLVLVYLALRADTEAKHYKRMFESQKRLVGHYKGKYNLLSYAVNGEIK